LGQSRPEDKMRTGALILLCTFLSCCYCQNSVFSPPKGQRCRGRNFDGKRCCTPEQPCGLGEGDCDGPGDGGVNDGHRGCQVERVDNISYSYYNVLSTIKDILLSNIKVINEK